MRKTFPSYCRPTDRELKNLWRECVFILDANVLLNLYRYPKEARDDLLRVLGQISDRLWIPNQAALEFQRNRLKVIAEQVKRFAEVRELFEKTTGDLRNGFDRLQLKKRHSSIATDDVLQKMGKVVNDFLRQLDELEREQPDVYSDDRLRGKIDRLLRGKIGSPADTQAELDELYAEGKTRFENGIPPGYRDVSKSKPNDNEPPFFVHNGLIYKREYGDWIIWSQILRESQERGWKYVILITDDDKDDWWWIVESKGKKQIGPRPQLVEEIRAKAGVRTFYLYNSERFLEFAEKYLEAEIELTTIEQVREVAGLQRAEIMRGAPLLLGYISVEQAVLNWLQEKYPGDEILREEKRFPDFIRIQSKDGSRIGYEVKFFRSNSAGAEVVFVPGLTMRLREVMYRGSYELSKGSLSDFKIIIVLQDASGIDSIAKALRSPRFEIPSGVGFIIGKSLTDDDGVPKSFEPLREI